MQLLGPSVLSLVLFIVAFALVFSGIVVIWVAGPISEDGGRSRSTGTVLIALGVIAGLAALLGTK